MLARHGDGRTDAQSSHWKRKAGCVCVCLVRACLVGFAMSFTQCLCLRPDLQGSEIFLGVCLDVCLCVGGRVASQPAMRDRCG